MNWRRILHIMGWVSLIIFIWDTNHIKEVIGEYGSTKVVCTYYIHTGIIPHPWYILLLIFFIIAMFIDLNKMVEEQIKYNNI